MITDLLISQLSTLQGALDAGLTWEPEAEPGVYICYGDDGLPVYVGSSENMEARTTGPGRRHRSTHAHAALYLTLPKRRH